MQNGEDELWKCSKHPSRRRRTGVCFFCLRDKLLTLCPDCAKALPCSCQHTYSNGRTSSSSSSSYSSYSSSSSSAVSHVSCTAIGVVGRMANLIDREPPFRRNTAFPWAVLKRDSERKGSAGRLSFCAAEMAVAVVEEEGKGEVKKLIRSRSVGGGKGRGRGWNLISPINVFRQIKFKKNGAGSGDSGLKLQ